VLKALEDDDSYYDEEEMAMITRRFKSSSRRPKKIPGRRTSANPEATIMSSSWIQIWKT